MAQYIKDGHAITASEKAYKLIYCEQGYLPVGNIKEVHGEPEKPTEEHKKDEGAQQDGTMGEPTPTPPEPPTEPSNEGITLKDMSYAELKEIAKKLEIPKYANTKQADLITLIQAKLGNDDGTKE